MLNDFNDTVTVTDVAMPTILTFWSLSPVYNYPISSHSLKVLTTLALIFLYNYLIISYSLQVITPLALIPSLPD